MSSTKLSHVDFGAVPGANNQTRFSVWAPKVKELTVELVQRNETQETIASSHPLSRDPEGLFSGDVPDCPAGSLYRYKLGNGSSRPDPRSRFQPHGVHGPSQVIDTSAYQWQDKNWKGINKRDLIIYEMHVGSFTTEGTYAAAIEKLGQLKTLGVTAIELLPLAQCPGKWNWGYDGVNYFAPSNNFGSPDQPKAFVDACHQAQLAVIIDVVYNHVGPEGNYLSEFGLYRSKKFGTPWGDAFDFDQAAVRQFVIDNVLFWVDEYHFDGLRLDAVHYMFDDKQEHIVAEVCRQFSEFQQTLDRKIHLIGESNIYDPEFVGETAKAGSNFDAIWSDCLMHSVYKFGAPQLRLTNRHYETSDIAQTLEHGYVFSAPKAIRVDDAIRATHHPTGDRRYIESLIMALQTHDSVGNHPQGKRIHQLMSFDFQKTIVPIFLLYPSIPMLFMGEEWATDAPFPFFADFEDAGLRQAVDKGRRDEYPHHQWEGSPLPSDPAAFTNSKLHGDLSSQQNKQEMFDWYQELLKLRKSGLESGWLSVDQWSTRCDLVTGVVQMMFERPEGNLTVCARIARDGSEPIGLDELGAGTILLNSKPDLVDGLHCEHGLIWTQ